MQRPVYAITGIMGCGKSTVGRLLEQLGATVIDADQLAREAMDVASPAFEQVVAEFGAEVLTAAGAIDRAKLAQRVFQNAELLNKLNGIVHPEVRRLFQAKCAAEQQRSTSEPIFYLVPLLFESGMSLDGFRATIAISCNPEEVIERVKQRDGWSLEAIEARLRAQLSNAEKCQRADFVLDNSGNQASLVQRVTDLYQKLLALGQK
jgi:dephospho-CoA kinase